MSLVDADVIDAFAVCLYCCWMLFDALLPDVMAGNDEVDVEDEEKAVLDVLQDAA